MELIQRTTHADKFRRNLSCWKPSSRPPDKHSLNSKIAVLSWTVLDILNKKLPSKPFDGPFGNPLCPSNFIGRKILGPDGPVNCFRIDAQNLGQVWNAQKFTRDLWLKLDSPIPRKWFVMVKLARPYFFWNLLREGITCLNFGSVKVFAIGT